MDNAAPLPPIIADHAEAIVAALQGFGWYHATDLLPLSIVAALRADLLEQRGKFTPAGVGPGTQRQQSGQRSDSTLWLSGHSDAQQIFLAVMEELRGILNRHLYLGLDDYEAHYAHYGPGQFYRRHVDAFHTRGRSGLPRRVVSTVCYLNEDWSAQHGGELLVWPHADGGDAVRIAPRGGGVVIFLSSQCPHEVLPTSADRYSIAGWFRTR